MVSLSKFNEFIEALGLVVFVLFIARVVHWLIGSLVASWPLVYQYALSIALAVVLLIVGLSLAFNQQDHLCNNHDKEDRYLE